MHGVSTLLPPAFVRAAEISPAAHLEMQAVLQAHVDNSISKTIYVPQDYPYPKFRSLYENAYAQGLKGCTTFRPNPVTGQVLLTGEADISTQCCSLDREAD